MKRALVVAMAAAVVAGVTGCGTARPHVAAPATTWNKNVAISADLPPSPATWPKYPHFSRHSCWGRPSRVTNPVGPAPSYAPARRAHPIPPATIVQRFLAQFGDRRYIRSITLGASPSVSGDGFLADAHPPADALHAYIHAPLTNFRNQVPHATPAQRLEYGIAEFETGLVGGALRDDFCSAGGAPLIAWSGDSNEASGFASEGGLEVHFPNPTPAAFRHRVALVGRRYGFHVVSLRLLHPEQLAPLLIVRTSRPRRAFVKDSGKIVALLSPTSFAPRLHRVAVTFEGFFFAAEDSRGPFMFRADVDRGAGFGMGWVSDPCLSPYSGMGPTGANATCR